MSQTLPDEVAFTWDTRVATYITYGADLSTGPEERLEGTNMVVISIMNTNYIYDGLDKHNSGYVDQPQRFTFTFSVPANTYTFRLLRGLLANKSVFHLGLEDPEARGEYKGVEDKLLYCKFSDMSIPFRVGDVPMASFSGKSLRWTYRNTDGDTDYEHEFGGVLPNETDAISSMGVKADATDYWPTA